MLAEVTTCFWRNIYKKLHVLALVLLNSVVLPSDELFLLQLSTNIWCDGSRDAGGKSYGVMRGSPIYGNWRFHFL